MYFPAVKRFAIVIFISTFALLAAAQQTHFVYLQTENGQPFYVKINNKIVSSSPAGYLILSKLTDGDYNLSVGFPKKEFPEENFQISVNKKNEGFLVKNFAEKGWGLFNLQSYGVVMGGNTDAAVGASKNLQDDPFSKLLANVVKDSSILQKNEPPAEEKPVSPKIDSSVAVAVKTEPLVTEPLVLSPATRFLRKKNKEGMEMIYIDHVEGKDDTIRIFIPLEKTLVKADNIDTVRFDTPKPSVTSATDTGLVAVQQPVAEKTDSTSTPASETKNPDQHIDTVAVEKSEDVKKAEVGSEDSVTMPGNRSQIGSNKTDNIVVLPKVVQSSHTNSDCRVFASNEDFLKLRKRMASESSEDNMIKIAKKSFHLKCFSTEQIKNLSYLFLTNAGKYMFFDLAYPFASDSDEYSTLQSQLTDSYYINRFNAMIHR